MDNYISRAIPKIIKFCSRASVKVQDNFYTIEYGEERQINDFNNVDIDKERQILIDKCNEIVDNQVIEIVDNLIKK